MAHPRVPFHPPAGEGHSSQSPPPRAHRQCWRRARTTRGDRRLDRLVPGAPAAGRRHRGGLCQLPGRDRRPAHPGTHGPREHRCGPRGRQRAVGAVRRRQRRGLPRHRAPACGGDRDARPPRAGRARPVAGGAPPSESAAGSAGGTPDAGRLRRLAGGSSHQRRRGGPGGALVRSARSLAVPRGRSA